MNKLDYPKLIISGGQSGADLAGNLFAREYDIDTEIRTFQGFKPIDHQDWALFESFRIVFLQHLYGKPYVDALRGRTVNNVLSSDATIIFVERDIELTRGSHLTWRLAGALAKPNIVIDVRYPMSMGGKKIFTFLDAVKPEILNIAGERAIPKTRVAEILKWGYQRLQSREEEKENV